MFPFSSPGFLFQTGFSDTLFGEKCTCFHKCLSFVYSNYGSTKCAPCQTAEASREEHWLFIPVTCMSLSVPGIQITFAWLNFHGFT